MIGDYSAKNGKRYNFATFLIGVNRLGVTKMLHKSIKYMIMNKYDYCSLSELKICRKSSVGILLLSLHLSVRDCKTSDII